MQGERTTAAFLETDARLVKFRLRATLEVDSIGYAPAVFFRATVMLQSELQFSAKSAGRSALLGVRVPATLRVRRCYLLSSFEDARGYALALRPSSL